MDIKITGVNRIIFEYCHFPNCFEGELKEKTNSIYKGLQTNMDLCGYLGVYINNPSGWVFGYTMENGVVSGKYYIIDELYFRKEKYKKMMGFGTAEMICNKFYLSY